MPFWLTVHPPAYLLSSYFKRNLCSQKKCSFYIQTETFRGLLAFSLFVIPFIILLHTLSFCSKNKCKSNKLQKLEDALDEQVLTGKNMQNCAKTRKGKQEVQKIAKCAQVCKIVQYVQSCAKCAKSFKMRI